jgi:hypothetical protein
MSEQQTPEMELMQELGFALDDLGQNRSGQISEMQDYKLRVRRQRSIFTGIAIMFCMAFIITLLFFMGNREGNSAILSIIGIGLTICNAAMMGVFARHWLRLSIDIREQRVLIISGELERIIKPINRRVIYYLIRVEGVELVVSKQLFNLVTNDKSYTLYRAPHTGTLLSLERVE